MVTPRLQPLCLLCETRLFPRGSFAPTSSRWQQSQSYAQTTKARRRTPSRMALSGRVAESTRRHDTGKFGKSRNSPFGGMNVTAANVSNTRNAPSAAELKRASRRQKVPTSEDRKATNEDTFHALKMQRSLSAVSYLQRNRIKEKIADIENFDQFQLLPAVRHSIASQALPGLEELVPTPIQRLAIPALLNDSAPTSRQLKNLDNTKMRPFLLAAETGSGKTLAYLLPVINAMKHAEALDQELEAAERIRQEQKQDSDPSYVQPPVVGDAPLKTGGRPRVIILVPSAELVGQLTTLAKSLSHTIKFRCSGISAGDTPKVIRNKVFSPAGVDLLISTPHLLDSIAQTEPNIASRITHLVVDEADSLFDRSFAPITANIIDRAASSLQQLILCSATIPISLDSYLRKEFPYIRRLVTPNLHAIPRRVQLGIVDVQKDPYRGNKMLACAEAIWSIGKAGGTVDSPMQPSSDTEAGQEKHLLVFVNEREKTQEVSEYLRSKGIDAVALNRDTPDQRRAEVLEQFTSTGKAKSTTSSINLQKQRLPNTKVLVTTDLASRGIDTIAVRHVILYDVPHSTIDFIHRLGRTGRMGRRGRGIVLVGKDDRKDVVREVREGMFRGQALI